MITSHFARRSLRGTAFTRQGFTGSIPVLPTTSISVQSVTSPRSFITVALNRLNPHHTAHFRQSAADWRHTPTASPRTAATEE